MNNFDENESALEKLLRLLFMPITSSWKRIKEENRKGNIRGTILWVASGLLALGTYAMLIILGLMAFGNLVMTNQIVGIGTLMGIMVACYIADRSQKSREAAAKAEIEAAAMRLNELKDQASSMYNFVRLAFYLSFRTVYGNLAAKNPRSIADVECEDRWFIDEDNSIIYYCFWLWKVSPSAMMKEDELTLSKNILQKSISQTLASGRIPGIDFKKHLASNGKWLDGIVVDCIEDQGTGLMAYLVVPSDAYVDMKAAAALHDKGVSDDAEELWDDEI